MPVFLKRFYINQLLKLKKQEQKQIDESQNKSTEIARPPVFKKSFTKR
tara:strand:+ start:461 stop:604 length:144 start_codon:yes stop_codon:yes gene_type:complete